MENAKFVSDLDVRFFNGELSEPFKNQLQQLATGRPDVFRFVERICCFMNRAGVPARDVSLTIGEVLGNLLARILPGAWEGRIPPITIPGRHRVIDQYIQSSKLVTGGNKTMLDVGCGFPPYTTLEAASNLSDWHITGIDPSFPSYLVYDTDQNYATFDKRRATIYFQPAVPSVENWTRLLSDSGVTKKRFEGLLEELLRKPVAATAGYPRLEVNPVKTYETSTLSFMPGEIGQVVNDLKGVIRCFNVLFYFDDSFYERALAWFTNITDENGVVIIGGNWAASTECYYNVYQKKQGTLVNTEFAFSLDCINPIGIATWFANYDDDRQTNELVKYIGIIRSDSSFMEAFYAVNDKQRKEYGICPRDGNGYYGGVDPAIDPGTLWMHVSAMLTGLNEAGLNRKAAEVLRRAGVNASVNEVGHLSVCQGGSR